MEFARFRPRVAVLLTSGALALAALVAGGCTSPDSDERGRFATVQGAVVDETGAPIANATVTVVPQVFPLPADPNAALGTRNYNGPTGPFVTDANGLFAIPSVPVTTDRNNPVVLNIRASAPGFLPALATQPAPESTSFAGRAFIQGVSTSDIVIASENVTGVVARLSRPGFGEQQQVQVSPSAVIALSGPNAVTVPGVAPLSLTGAQNSVSAAGTLTATGLSGSSIAGFAAAPPTTVPAAGGSSAPAGTVAPGATARATAAVGGLSVEFGQGVTLVRPLTATIDVSTFGDLASSLRVVFFDTTTGTWKLVASTLSPLGVLTFDVAQPGTYAVVLGATWTIGAVVPAAAGEGPVAQGANANETKVILPPLAAFPNGYVVSGRLLENINFTGGGASLLAAAYQAVTGDVATLAPAAGDVVEVVPPAPAGLECTKVKFSVSVVIDGASDGPVEATRYTWSCTQFTAAQAETAIPAHLQGHIQGGGVGF